MRKIEFMDIKYVILIEPERLILRYLIKGNSIFLFLAIKQLSKKILFRKKIKRIIKKIYLILGQLYKRECCY